MYRIIQNGAEGNGEVKEIIKEKLLTGYRRPWNRTKKEIEEKIVLLKEKDPTLTVRKAKEILERQGIKISIKGIWGVWKRAGFAGFKKEKISNDWTECYSWSKSARRKFEVAKGLFKAGKIEKAAKILNSILCLPKNDLLEKIPDDLLNLRRKVEKIHSLFGKINIHSYIKRIENLYQECLKRGLNYSALRIGLTELIALEWLGRPEEGFKKIEELKKIIERKGNYYSYLLFEVRFTLLISQGIFNVFLSKIKSAQNCANLCKRMLERRKILSPYLMIDLGILYTHIEDYNSAEYWLLKAINQVDEENKKRVKYYLSLVLLAKGEYKRAKEISKDAYFEYWGTDSLRFLFYSLLFLLKGQPEKAISFCNKVISLLKKEEIGIGIFYSYFTMSASYFSMEEKTKAKSLLKRALLFFKSKKVQKYVDIIESLLESKKGRKNEMILPCLNLIFLLKKGEYFKAFNIAKKKGITSYFYRYIFFFPEVVIKLIERGKNPELPKSILKLPIFNEKAIVYEIRFLGKLIAYKIQRKKSKEKIYIRQKLSPKDSAFLIHFALRAGEPGKEIPLDEIYKNFWPSQREKRARRNLSHLLLRIKKALKIPSHLLEISYKKDYSILKNKGIYFITDYTEFEHAFAQANAFLRAGEWEFAKKEFIRGFNLIREEPFKKMYDSWSDDMRMVILNRYEKEVLRFAKEYLTRLQYKKYRDGKKEKEKIKKILVRADKIIRYSHEIKQMIKSLSVLS